MPAIGVVLIVLVIILGVLYKISFVLGVIGSVALLAFIVYFIVFLIKDQLKKGKKNDTSSVEDSNIKKVFTKVAGVTYEDRQSILPTLHSGMPLELFREPNNFHDKNAIALYCNGKMIGYIKRDLAMGLAFLIDRGTRVEGEIVEITGGDGLTYGCNIELTIYKQKL